MGFNWTFNGLRNYLTSTYPINAVGMVRNRITTPMDHVCVKLYDP
jgi:hypothetical protein